MITKIKPREKLQLHPMTRFKNERICKMNSKNAKNTNFILVDY